jgi:hypothetical protein
MSSDLFAARPAGPRTERIMPISLGGTVNLKTHGEAEHLFTGLDRTRSPRERSLVTIPSYKRAVCPSQGAVGVLGYHHDGVEFIQPYTGERHADLTDYDIPGVGEILPSFADDRTVFRLIVGGGALQVDLDERRSRGLVEAEID